MTEADRGPDVADVFVELVEALRPGNDVIDAMDVLVRACVDTTGAAQATVVLADGEGLLHAVASTHERTLDVEEAQIGTEEGPCLECVRTGEIVEVADLTEAELRWPAFAAVARATGTLAGLAIPLRVGDRTLGGLNVFLTQPGRLPLADVAVLQALTQVAGISLLQRRAHDERGDLIAQLEGALESRVLIEQAKGYLASQHGTGVADAFRLLRSEARRRQRPLREVAERVLQGELAL